MSEPFVRFEVDAAPVPMPRPRVTVQGGRAHAYMPAQVAAAERAIHAAALKAKGARPPLGGPVAVTVIAYLKPPLSAMTRGRRGVARPIQRPDLDNFLKTVLDGCFCLWHDDAQVVELLARKEYAWEGDPRWWIEVCPCE